MMKIINMLVVYFTNVFRLGVLNWFVLLSIACLMLLLIVKLSIVIKVVEVLRVQIAFLQLVHVFQLPGVLAKGAKAVYTRKCS